MKIKYYKQPNDYFCGPACLQMILDYKGIKRSQATIAKMAKTNAKVGTPNKTMLKVLNYYKIPYQQKFNASIAEIKKSIDLGFPVLIDFIEPVDNEFHYAIATGYTAKKIVLQDPANGKDFTINQTDLLKRWRGSKKKYRHWMLIVK